MATLNQILAGIKVFVDKGIGDHHGIAAEHDEIYIGGDVELTDDDKATLTAAGWHWDEALTSWTHFV
jgi:hypothetical protein